ncbi:MAG: acyl-CoA dehydrogenase [Deltaproteobacteria bacterium CG2_30_63_29]|nr:MAG: acyl-CoA dehydrogenase [Deltaproteobacteria bacterium CG2_30_63_29]PJB46714.1 MAG: acyl-CoA dehydrogenase [Deltaproteobacteria bacterium CG_4_9_14_3_um_filter_63_12]
MASEQHYKSNLRDIHFNLFEFLRIQDTTLGQGCYDHVDRATVVQALGTMERISVNEMAASFVPSDRIPLVLLADGTVQIPEAMKKSLKAYWDGDWHRMSLPLEMGGFGMPPSVSWASFEMASGANPAACFYMFGATVAWVIETLGTESQKKRFVAQMLDAPWGGSMALTEAEAGSDVGAGRTSAKHLEGDVWELEGGKRFITNGDFDAVENIVHLVLARPEGAASGTKGLSMFIVPKFWVGEDGKLGERNGVNCTAIEKKMGIKGSATCEMVFGGDVPARGLLVGNVHNGIRQMFHLIEHARMGVGIKSMATLSTGYLNALAYTKERIQGPDLLDALKKDPVKVAIIAHPDVRRMLMLQKSYAEGMRALCMYAAWLQDKFRLATPGSAEAKAIDKQNDLLLPMVKGFCSDKAAELLPLSLQCLGGSGYCQDFPIEQYVRDQKIDSLYEGTTHIQALDLIFRKIAKDGGQTLRALMGEIRQTAEGPGSDALADARGALLRAAGDVEGIFGAMMGKMQESLYHVALHANAILSALSEVIVGWLLIRQAQVAHDALEGASESDRPFYEGKVAAAQFFAHEVFPGLTLTRKKVEKSDLAIMKLSVEAF